MLELVQRTARRLRLDPLTLATVAIATCIVALLSAYIPARRAMLVDPMTSLRNA